MPNLIAIVLAAVAGMAVGFLWYSPMLFGESWMRLSGIKPKGLNNTKKGMNKTYIIAFISALVMAFVLSLLLTLVKAHGLLEALQIGFLAWAGFIATTLLNDVLYERKSWHLFLINASYQLTNALIMAVVLTLMSTG